MRSPSSLYVCPPYQLLNKLTDLKDIQYGGHAIEGDLDAISFSPMASTIPKADIQASEVDAKLVVVSAGPFSFVC
jgi:hypothetical protein